MSTHIAVHKELSTHGCIHMTAMAVHT